MMQSNKKDFQVVYDHAIIDKNFGPYSPFNLKKNLKDISESEAIEMSKAIAAELKTGPGRPTYQVLHTSPLNIKITYAKIRCRDRSRSAGKSKGWRCIVLIDNINSIGFVLHVFSHRDKDNISQNEHNALRRVVEEYIKAVSRYSN